MNVQVSQVGINNVAHLREQYRLAMDAQIVRWCWPSRGFTDAYAVRSGGADVGYALIGSVATEPRDAVVEFFVRKPERANAAGIFERVLAATGARRILLQSNDPFLLAMHDAFARGSTETHFLFAPHSDSRCADVPTNALFGHLGSDERGCVFRHTSEPIGEWCVRIEGDIVATGGYLSHYNPPWVDMFMEVAPCARRRGIGSFLVRSLMSACNQTGLRAAARCRVENYASRACLDRAGMIVVGRLIESDIGRQPPVLVDEEPAQ